MILAIVNTTCLYHVYTYARSHKTSNICLGTQQQGEKGVVLQASISLEAIMRCSDFPGRERDCQLSGGAQVPVRTSKTYSPNTALHIIHTPAVAAVAVQGIGNSKVASGRGGTKTHLMTRIHADSTTKSIHNLLSIFLLR